MTTSTAVRLLKQLEILHVTVEVDGERLRLKPAKRIPPYMVERLRDHKAQLIDELRRYDALRDLPFPIGYVGLPIVELEAALRFNYTQGISDPVERKLNILIWIMSYMAGNGDTGEHYQGIKDEYHRLRHEDRTTTDECGICEYLD